VKTLKNVNKKQENVKLFHILHVQHQKFPSFNVSWQCLIFGKIQDGAQYGSHLE